VVMRRMPADRSLATLLGAGRSAAACVQAVARQVADFHARAVRSGTIAAAGSHDAVAALWSASIDDLATAPDALVDGARLTAVRSLAEGYLAGRSPLFDERVRRGLIVDGHGDLLCADIYCLDDGPRVLDCLEFDERFRYGDVLLDVAFLAMDLHWRGRGDLAGVFMDTYAELSDEHHPATLLAHYVAYRALVRAKVAAYRARSGHVAAATESAGLLGLCHDQLRAGAVHLVLVGGLPGTGKTALADALSGREGWAVVSTDAVRRELTGGPTPAAYGTGAYTPEATGHVYDLVFERAAAALARGESVVIDASFADAARRAAARSVAARSSSLCSELRCVAPAEVARARLAGRVGATLSDADASVAARMAEAFTPWPEATVVDTTSPIDETVAAAVAAVERSVA
jgi:predicted kinase